MIFRIALGLLLAALAGCTPTPTPGPVLLGHLNPTDVEEERQAIELAVDRINADAAKWVLGRQLKAIHASLGVTPEEAQGQAARFLTIDHVDALLGPSRWNQVDRVALSAQSPPTPVFTFNGFAGAPSSQVLFPVGVSPSERGRALARFCKSKKEKDRLPAIVVLKEIDHPIAEIVARSFTDEFGRCPTHTLSATDSLEGVCELKDGKAAMALICGTVKTVQAWRAKMPAIPILFGGEESQISLLSGRHSSTQAIYAAASFHAGDGSAGSKEFVARFKERYGKEPSSVAAVAYDAVNLWAEASRRGNSIAFDKCREQLLKPDAVYEVTTGRFRYGEGQAPVRPVFVIGVGDKFFVRYDP